jgi:hypothetical protein
VSTGWAQERIGRRGEKAGHHLADHRRDRGRAAVLDTAKYRGKVLLTGLGTPDSLKKYVSDGTIKAFGLWNPANLGYLAGYPAG